MRASPSPGAPPFMVCPRLPVAHGPKPWGVKGRPRLAARSGCLPAAVARDQCITRALTGTCREHLDCSGPSSPTARASGAFVPEESALKSPGSAGIPVLGGSLSAGTPCNPHPLPASGQELRSNTPAHRRPPPRPTRSPRLDPCGKNPTARFLQSDAARILLSL